MRCLLILFWLLPLEAADYRLPLDARSDAFFIDGRELELDCRERLSCFSAPALFLPRGRHLYRLKASGRWRVITVTRSFSAQYARTRQAFDKRAAFEKSLCRKLAQTLDHPDDPLLLHWLGNLYAAAGEEKAALRAYRRALQINPCLAVTHLNVAHIVAEYGNRKAARHHLQMAETFNTQDVFGIAAAITRYRVRLKLTGKRRASLQMYHRTDDAAEDRLDRRWQNFGDTVLKYLPSSLERAKFTSNRGRYYEDRKKYEQAILLYRRALALLKKAPSGSTRNRVARVIFLNLARTFEALGWAERTQYRRMAQALENA